MSTTSILDDSVRGRYINDYIAGVESRRVYDQFTYPISQDKEILQRSTSITVPFLSSMSISAQTISETVDITPQTLRDTTASLTPTSRGDAIQDSELLLKQSYTDYGQQRFRVVGDNMMETLEALLVDTALAGSMVSRYVARASLDAGTALHRLSYAAFAKAESYLTAMMCPQWVEQEGQGYWAAAFHPDIYYDLRTSTPIVEIAEYQNANVILNNELGALGRFRLVVSPWAKVFMSAGLANGTAAAYTLSAAASALDKSLSITTATNVASGRLLTVGTIETGDTFYPMNERVDHVSGTTTSVIVGQGSNGGLKYDHANGSTVSNADSVYPVLFGGPMSIAKAYASDVGEYGEVVGPKMSGNLDQFVSLGWKFYGGYGRINENWLIRGEYSSSLDA